MPFAAYLLLLALFLLAMTTFAALRSDSALEVTSAVMMICVPFLGMWPIALFGYSTNAGNIFYAVGMFGICAKFLLYGAASARNATNVNLFAFVMVFGSVFALQCAHVVGSEYNPLIQLAGARLIAFALGQSFYIYLLGRQVRRLTLRRVMLATLSLQIVDALMFFPLAFFGLLPPGKILEYAVVGVLTGSAITLLSGPLLAVLVWRGRGRSRGEARLVHSMIRQRPSGGSPGPASSDRRSQIRDADRHGGE